jgi:FixJ family two-component response regulator
MNSIASLKSREKKTRTTRSAPEPASAVNGNPAPPAALNGAQDGLVAILDDDPMLLTGLERLLTGHGYEVRVFDKACDLLACQLPDRPCCVILDNDLGDSLTGLDVHAEIRRRGWPVSVLFLTGHWDVPSIVDAVRNGAEDFLTKPLDHAVLVHAVSKAVQKAREHREEAGKSQALTRRAGQLTPRELEIVRLVASGLLNKEIADQLKIALVTVKVHRGRAMRKLGAGNAAELARIAALAGIVQ